MQHELSYLDQLTFSKAAIKGGVYGGVYGGVDGLTLQDNHSMVGGFPLIRDLFVPIGLIHNRLPNATFSNESHALIDDDLFDRLYSSVEIKQKQTRRNDLSVSHKITRKSRR
jgi:hypothetical protein